MTRYWKINIYVTGEDYETREILIEEPTFRKYQKAIAEGSTHLILEDRVIKTTSIKEILPADEIVQGYLSAGVSLKTLGLKEPVGIESGPKAPKFLDEARKNIGKI